MSANATTAMHGQSSHVGPLGAAAVLTAVVAFGALGFAIGQGVATTTTTAARPAAGPVIDDTTMSGPRSAAQRGLGNATGATSGVDSRFAAQYGRYLAAQQAAQHAAAIAATKDAGASIVVPGSDFPDLYQRTIAQQGAAYSGSDFAGQYEQWLKAQAAAASSDFPDYFERHAAPVSGGSGGRGVRLAQ